MTESLSSVYYNGTFEGQENPTFTSISSFMQENQIELVPVVMLAEPKFMYCANSRKMMSVLENSNDDDSKWNTKIYAFICYMYVSCLLLQIEIVFCLTQILLNSG